MPTSPGQVGLPRPARLPSEVMNDSDSLAADRPLFDRVAYVIDRIRPAVQADGGDLELVEVTPENIARIRLHGACIGCPSASLTLKMGVERNLQTHVPEIAGVEALEH